MTSEYDLVVVGGGPAGSTAATAVAPRGHRVLLERWPPRSPSWPGEWHPATRRSARAAGSAPTGVPPRPNWTVRWAG
ncbi:FAD-dependent oxidoreductase [Streptomyces sp. NPDC002588]|uniref:FAD-dependent oxidoreductase n=1 Tax=Streptomyces sp. NPDC002588 TaxID=3154419 RepID=UPI0033229796